MAVPRIGTKSKRDKRPLKEIPGMVPSLHHLPKGCLFSLGAALLNPFARMNGHRPLRWKKPTWPGAGGFIEIMHGSA